MTNEQKLAQVREILKTVEEIVADHIEDGGELDAMTLIDQALEMHKCYLEDEGYEK